MAGPAQLILLVLLWSDTVVRETFWAIIMTMSSAAGAEPLLVYHGYREFMFWKH
jgi:hypothetical protein